MRKLNSRANQPMRFGVDLVIGSTGKAVSTSYDRLIATRENGFPSFVRVVVDAKEPAPADLVDGHRPDDAAKKQLFVSAEQPSGRVSRQQAEEEGLLSSNRDWDRQSQVARDGEGAGGVPRNGYEMVATVASDIMTRMNYSIQQVREYGKRILPIAAGECLTQQVKRVQIHVYTSACGGTGTGGLVWLAFECIATCALANNIELKVVLHLLSLGTLQTHDSEQARMNEFVTLKFIQQLATQAYMNALTQRILPCPFDHLRLYTDGNNSGRMGSLKTLVHHQAHLQRYIRHTPGGAAMQEREPDIGHWRYGRFEDPLCVYTASVGCVHWNKGRLADCLAYKATAIFTRRILAEGHRDRVIQEATSIAAAADLIESEEENQLTKSVSHPDELAGDSVYARAEQDLINAVGGTRGIERGNLLCERIPVSRDEVQSIYHPQMCDKAHSLFAEAKETLSRRVGQTLRQARGLWEAMTLLEFILSILARAREAIAAKVSEIQEFRTSHDHAVAEAAEQLQELAETGRLRRSMSFQAVRAVNAVLEESGRATINYQLQITACTVATEEVLTPLAEFVGQRLAAVKATRQSLTALVPRCRDMARDKANERTVEDPAIGLEIVAEEYVESCFAEFLARNGGADDLADQLRSRFLQEHGSLGVLTGKSSPEIEECLLRVCRPVFEPGLENTNVLAEFQKVYEEKTQNRILAELINQCEGRLVVEGEVNKNVAWVKTANVPAQDQAERMQRMLENADHKAGTWQVAVNPDDSETFSIGQLRGEISLTQFIDRCDIEDTYENWCQLVARAADPVSAIGVGPNPTPRQFRRVLAKAIAAGLLNVDADGNFTFRDFTGEELVLGADADAIFQELQPRFRRLVFVESYWAGELVDSEPQIVATLKEMKAQLQDTAGDKLLGLVDVTATLECLQQADLLRPWARQIQKRRKRTEA